MSSPVDTNIVFLTGSGEKPYLSLSKTGVAGMELSHTALSAISGFGDRSMSLTTPTADVNSATLASSGDITLDASADLKLSAGSSSLVFTADSMITTTVGGSTDKYLRVMINNVSYCISLLASFPVLPYEIYIDPFFGYQMFQPTPPLNNQTQQYTVSITVVATTGDNTFQAYSYNSPDITSNFYQILTTPLVVGTNVYEIHKPFDDTYIRMFFLNWPGGSFDISSFIINGTEQLVPPNLSRLVLPV
jgi:hypothetical protein